MNIQKIEIQNIRGIRYWKEDFNGQNVRILGPNGSGKSSVIQAIEFLLIGDITQLRGEGTQGVPFSEYASHINADSSEAFVQATFEEPGERQVAARRFVDQPDTLEVIEPDSLSSAPEWLQQQMEAAELGHSILDRDRLLRFITAPEGKRGDRIDELFRLEGVDDKRRALKRAARDHESTVKGRKSSKSQADKRFFELFPSGISNRDKALEIINKRRKEHGAEPVDSLDDDFTDGVETYEHVSIDPLQNEGTVSLIEEIREWINRKSQQVIQTEQELRRGVASLREAENVERELNTLDLVDRGLSLLEEYESQCPLCLKEWEEDELEEHLQERHQNAQHLEEEKNQIESHQQDLIERLTRYLDDLEQLQKELQDEYPETDERIKQVIEQVEEWRTELKGGTLTELPGLPDDRETSEEYLFPESLDSILRDLLRQAEEMPEPKSATSNVDFLVRADDRYQDLVEKEQALQKVEAVQQMLVSIEDHFLETRSRVLTEAFSEIREKFEGYYEEMHKDAEAEDFSAVLQPTDTGVRFEPAFYDEGHHNPSAIHSEGHRDSMGLALFLAMSDVGGEGIDILLLDDVIMSIDSDHRSNIASLLADEIADRYQIVLTTHDKTWDRHLKLTQAFKKSVRFAKCSLSSGPMPVGSISDPWERIEHHLERDDVTAAAGWIRKTVEWYSRRACKHLQAEVPYHQLEEEELTIGRLFDTALSRYESLLEDGRASERTDYDSEELAEELEAVREARSDKERHLNLLNTNIHHNEPEAAFYTGEELRNERDAFKKAYDLLHCSDCQSWVKKGNWGIYCNCTTKADLQ